MDASQDHEEITFNEVKLFHWAEDHPLLAPPQNNEVFPSTKADGKSSVPTFIY